MSLFDTAGLTALFRNAPFGIVIYEGPAHVAVLSNPRHDEMVAHRLVLGKPLLESMPELAGQFVYEILDAVYRTGVGRSVPESPTQLIRGGALTDCWFDLDYRPLHDGDGRVVAVTITAIEITEHVLNRRRLEAANRFATTVAANATLGLAVLDARQHLTFMNAAAEKIFGLSLAEVTALDKPLHDIVHHTRPDGSPYPMAECPIDRALPRRMQEQGEDVFVRPDGTFYPVAFTASPIVENGVPVGTVIEVEDISERVRAKHRLEVLLKASSAIMRARLDLRAQLTALAHIVTPELGEACVVCLVDQEGGTLTPRTWAHARGEGQSRLDAYFDVPHAMAVLETPLAVSRPAAKDAPPPAALTDLLAYLGADRLYAVPIRSPRAVIGLLCVVRERETAHDLGLLQELADRAALAIEAALLYEDSQAGIRVRDEFLSISSHELRTPLTALQLQLQGLEAFAEKTPLPNADKFQHRLAVATRQVTRLTRLVDEILDVARLSQGRLRLEPEPCSLNEVVKDVVERHESQAAAAGASLQVTADGEATGRWDRFRLEQVVTNLIANAIKYAPGKPIEITVQARPAVARLCVKDHGLGIAPADLDRIFGRFERAGAAQGIGGLGLGLYIARELVEAHGGTIQVRSRPGLGSEFTVNLPRTLPAEKATP
jgi:PAS domain S-box-containing protein